MALETEVRDRKLVNNPEGVTEVRCRILVLDGAEVVNTRQFSCQIHRPGVTQEAVQARLNEAKDRALSEAETARNIDVEALQ